MRLEKAEASRCKTQIEANKWLFIKDYYFFGEIIYSKGIYKDVSECNAGWYRKIGSLI
jgi:hypothetical protein